MTRRTLASEARFLSNIFEVSVTEILEEEVAHSDGSDKQVWQSVVVDVCGCGRHADFVFQAHARGSGNILKLATSEIAPKLITPELINEINIEAAVAIHIGN